MPRPPKNLTKKELKEIEAMSGIGLTQEMIADMKGMCVDTLRKYADAELKRGRARGVARLADTAFKKALAGDTTLLIFLLKVRGGFREKPEVPKELLALLNGLGDDTDEDEA